MAPVDVMTNALDASPEPSGAPAASGLAAQRLKLFGQRQNLKIFATAAIAVLVLAAGVLDRSLFRTIAGPSASPTSPVLSPQSDLVRSSRSADEGQFPKGIIPIVVLPFIGLGGSDDSIQLTADMLTDDLTNRLSRVTSFRVISRQTARSFQVQTLDVAKLGDELHVRYVLEGSVRPQDDNLRVNVELINPATRLSVWSGHVERDRADRQGVRDEIVARLARELQFEVLPIESLRLSEDADADALAYRGWAALSKVNLGGYNEGLALFNKALERDPENLSAQIGTGAYHARMGSQVLDTDSAAHRIKA
jgi:TolB-like protein